MQEPFADHPGMKVRSAEDRVRLDVSAEDHQRNQVHLDDRLWTLVNGKLRVADQRAMI